MPVVAMPDGTQVGFPDEMPREQIKALIASKFPEVWKADDPAQVRPGMTAEAPDIGRGTAIALGGLQGITARFGDELAGVAAAGRPIQSNSLAANAVNYLSMATPAGAIGTLARGAAGLVADYFKNPTMSSLITGQKPKGVSTQAYEEARDYIRNLDKTAQEQYPGSYLTGNIGGAIASPVTRVVRAPQALGATATFLDRMRQAVPYGIKTGATYGAVSGAGAGEGVVDSATKAAEGALIGGAVGGAVPPVVEGAIQGARAVASPVISAVRGIRDPQGEAARRTVTALQRDVAADPQSAARLTQQEFTQSAQNAGPATVMDLGGETTRALARSAANTSPEGRAVLSQSINDRFEQQAPRMAEWFNNTFNYGTPQARDRVIRDVAQTVYEPRYARAWADSAGRNLWHGLPELQSIVQDPTVQSAIRVAGANMKSWMIRDGVPPNVAKQNINPFVIENGRVSLRQTQAGNDYLPSLRFWDYIKRALDQQGTQHARAFARTIRETLDQEVPAYRAAREAAQPTKFFGGAPNAFEAGQNFINQGQRYGADAQRQLARMTDPRERQLFQDGYVTALIDRIERAPDRRNILNTIGNTPSARREIETALGPQRWRQLEATLRVEGIMDMARPAVQGNSTTARQLMELGLAGGAGGFEYLMNGDPSAVMHAALVWGAARGQRGIDSRVARHVAQLLTSNNPQDLQRGVQMIARNNQFLNQLRRVDAALSRVGTEQTPRPMLQLSGTARPENDEPSVPRPPGQ